jgi:hypothetical protein
MATAYITEFRNLGLDGGAQIAPRPGLASQTVAIGGTSAQSTAFSGSTRYIRVHVDAVCSSAVGANPTATIAGERMAADNTEYFAVNPGDKIAFITNT